jgi:hypothetical protein
MFNATSHLDHGMTLAGNAGREQPSPPISSLPGDRCRVAGGRQEPLVRMIISHSG